METLRRCMGNILESWVSNNPIWVMEEGVGLPTPPHRTHTQKKHNRNTLETFRKCSKETLKKGKLQTLQSFDRIESQKKQCENCFVFPNDIYIYIDMFMG